MHIIFMYITCKRISFAVLLRYRRQRRWGRGMQAHRLMGMRCARCKTCFRSYLTNLFID